jgi:hypothetical protein
MKDQFQDKAEELANSAKEKAGQGRDKARERSQQRDETSERGQQRDESSERMQREEDRMDQDYDV